MLPEPLAVLELLPVLPLAETELPADAGDPLVPALEPAEPLLWLPPPAEPDWDGSAWANPDPLAIAAPSPKVTAPAPSHVDVAMWRPSAPRRAFAARALALARFVVRCLPAMAVPDLSVVIPFGVVFGPKRHAHTAQPPIAGLSAGLLQASGNR